MGGSHGLEQGGFGPISRRELEVLDLFGRGHGAKGVARQLEISYETVRTHQKNIYRKLGVNSLVQALVEYHRQVESPFRNQSP